MPEIRVTPLGACPSCGRVLVLPPGRGSRAPSSTDTRTGFHVLPHGESASSEGAPCPGVDTGPARTWAEAASWSPLRARMSCWTVECTWASMTTDASLTSPTSPRTAA
ncbi:INTS11 isoform 21 [Pan troglodytes]|uniref:INTS11 isoform 21 n=1 Tax=Pan troglodytes TaxID=9598 RepID=A0A2J8IRP7_PANTR|nr:INTS11 isoform 21 [Pan troglodytes]